MDVKNWEEAADLIENNRDEIEQALEKALHFPQQKEKQSFVKNWIDVHLRLFREKGDHTADAIADLCEWNIASGGALSECLDQLRALRRGLVDTLESHWSDPRTSLCLCHELEERYTRQASAFWERGHFDGIASERRRLRLVSEFVDIPFLLLDSEARVEHVNRRCSDLLHSPVEEIVGRTLGAWLSPDTEAKIHRAMRRRNLKGRNAFPGELIRASGKRIPVECAVEALVNVQGECSGLAVFIKNAPSENVQEAPYGILITNAVFQNFPMLAQVMNHQREILFVNDNMPEVLPELDRNKPFCCQLLPIERMTTCLCLQVTQDGKARQEERSYQSEGKRRWFLVTVVPLQSEGETSPRLACLVLDITERRVVERHVDSLLVAQQQQVPLPTHLAITVAHELRNPLSVVTGFAEMLNKGLPSEWAPDVISKILRNSLRCKEIVDNLLEFGRGLPQDMEMVNLQNLIWEHVHPALTTGQQRMIQWELPEEPCLVECATQQLAQVLLNLLRNALRAADKNVRLHVSLEDPWIRIHIQDDGPGVPEEHRDDIFKPFFTTHKQEGAMGLGLSLSQAVLMDCGGRLYLASEERDAPEWQGNGSSGACLIMDLPRMHASESIVPAKPSGASLSQRVLIVDDEPDLLVMLSMALEMIGLEVHSASTGNQALEMMANKPFDAVALDIQLPDGISGIQCFQRIQDSHPELAQRTLFITADTMNFETKDFLQRVGRPYLEKPFLIQEFVECIDLCIQNAAPA